MKNIIPKNRYKGDSDMDEATTLNAKRIGFVFEDPTEDPEPEKEMINEDDDSTGYDWDAECDQWEDNCAGYEARMLEE